MTEPEQGKKENFFAFSMADKRAIFVAIVMIFVGPGLFSLFNSFPNFLSGLFSSNVLKVLKIHTVNNYSPFYFPLFSFLYIILVWLFTSVNILAPDVGPKFNKIINRIYLFIVCVSLLFYLPFTSVNVRAHNNFLRMKETALCLNLDNNGYRDLQISILNAKTLTEAETLTKPPKACKSRVKL